MKCAHVAVRRGFLAPCGRCAPCLINRRRIWATRLLLERYFHKQSWFITLTYDDSHLPSDGSVSRREVQLFLKRLRKGGQKVRYYAVGEYGERYGRPHYHLVLYGLDDVGFRIVRGSYVLTSPSVSAAWCKDGEPIGHVHIGELNALTAAYITGYVSKKFKARRADGRTEEFAQPSLRPAGLGAGIATELSRFWNSEAGSKELVERGDVTHEIRIGGKRLPIGRYLKRKVREASGYGQDMPSVARLAEMVRVSVLMADPKTVQRLREQGDVAVETAGMKVRSQFARRKL